MMENGGETTSNTECAFTSENPNFPLCTSPETQALPGQRDGSVQRPSLLPNVVQDPG